MSGRNGADRLGLTLLWTGLILYILGVSSLKEFAGPLMVGIIGGMFTNIFIPCSLWYMMMKKKKADKK